MHCTETGIVRSVSIAASGATFEHAAGLIKQIPGIGIGVHLCLVAEKPVLSKVRIPSIVTEEGLFYDNPMTLFLKLATRKINLAEVTEELDAQIRKVLDMGIAPTHLDSHQYAYLTPPIFMIVIQLAKKYHIKWLRYPGCDTHMYVRSAKSLIKKFWIDLHARQQTALLRSNTIRYPDYSYGVMINGGLNEQILRDFFKKIGSGISDITCHPGYYPKNKRYQKWGYGWQTELQTLVSPELMRLLDTLNIKLRNYAY